MPVALFAVFWGVAEATLFFVVPDVLLTYVALRSLRRALLAAVLASAGAVLGGSLMIAWGAHDAEAAYRAIDRTPAVSSRMIERVSDAFEARGAVEAAIGSFSGTPFKIYAVAAGEQGYPVPLFLATGFLARLPRFVLSALLAHGIARAVSGRWSVRTRFKVLSGFWVAFYALFWSLMPG